MLYVRYEAAAPNARGHHTGIFGLANGLRRRGELTPEDREWLQANNSWLDEAYTDPGLVDPTLFDKAINPTATCWFKATAAAEPLLAKVPGHLALLDRYGIEWRVRQTTKIGRILYEDPVQAIADGTATPAALHRAHLAFDQIAA